MPPLQRRLLVSAALALLVGGVVWGRLWKTSSRREPPIPAASPIPAVTLNDVEFLAPQGVVPDFALTESHDQKVTRGDLLGKIWVADLMFTSCGNTCPLLGATMSRLDHALGARDDVRLVSITVTPEFDKPEVLREYGERFHASNKWLFLTGDRAQIAELAGKGFHLSTGEPGTLAHSNQLVLIDRTGNVRGFFDGTSLESVAHVEEAIRRLK